jgi:hypothetical protein
MITFKSHDDLNKLDTNAPEFAVMKELIELLIDAYTYPGHPYLPDDYGYLVLIEEGDVDKIIDLPEVQCNLLDVMWEGASMRGNFYYAIYLGNDEFGIGFVIPDAEWVRGDLRILLDELVSC